MPSPQVPSAPNYFISDEEYNLTLLTVLPTPNCPAPRPSPSPKPPNPEVAALLEIRAGFSNGEALLPDWSSSASSPFGWTGIVCDGDASVVQL